MHREVCQSWSQVAQRKCHFQDPTAPSSQAKFLKAFWELILANLSLWSENKIITLSKMNIPLFISVILLSSHNCFLRVTWTDWPHPAGFLKKVLSSGGHLSLSVAQRGDSYRSPGPWYGLLPISMLLPQMAPWKKAIPCPCSLIHLELCFLSWSL